MRNSGFNEIPLLAALQHKEGIVIAQRSVDGKTNEITELQALLDPLALEDKVVTADALQTQVEHARYLVEEKKADYFFHRQRESGNLEKGDRRP